MCCCCGPLLWCLFCCRVHANSYRAAIRAARKRNAIPHPKEAVLAAAYGTGTHTRKENRPGRTAAAATTTTHRAHHKPHHASRSRSKSRSQARSRSRSQARSRSRSQARSRSQSQSQSQPQSQLQPTFSTGGLFDEDPSVRGHDMVSHAHDVVSHHAVSHRRLPSRPPRRTQRRRSATITTISTTTAAAREGGARVGLGHSDTGVLSHKASARPQVLHRQRPTTVTTRLKLKKKKKKNNENSNSNNNNNNNNNKAGKKKMKKVKKKTRRGGLPLDPHAVEGGSAVGAPWRHDPYRVGSDTHAPPLDRPEVCDSVMLASTAVAIISPRRGVPAASFSSSSAASQSASASVTAAAARSPVDPVWFGNREPMKDEDILAALATVAGAGHSSNSSSRRESEDGPGLGFGFGPGPGPKPGSTYASGHGFVCGDAIGRPQGGHEMNGFSPPRQHAPRAPRPVVSIPQDSLASRRVRDRRPLRGGPSVRGPRRRDTSPEFKPKLGPHRGRKQVAHSNMYWS